MTYLINIMTVVVVIVFIVQIAEESRRGLASTVAMLLGLGMLGFEAYMNYSGGLCATGSGVFDAIGGCIQYSGGMMMLPQALILGGAAILTCRLLGRLLSGDHRASGRLRSSNP